MLHLLQVRRSSGRRPSRACTQELVSAIQRRRQALDDGVPSSAALFLSLEPRELLLDIAFFVRKLLAHALVLGLGGLDGRRTDEVSCRAG